MFAKKQLRKAVYPFHISARRFASFYDQNQIKKYFLTYIFSSTYVTIAPEQIKADLSTVNLDASCSIVLQTTFAGIPKCIRRAYVTIGAQADHRKDSLFYSTPEHSLPAPLTLTNHTALRHTECLTGDTMKPGRESDQQLVDRARHGSRDAFNLLVTRHRDRLLRQLSPLMRDSNEAEDVVQETFLKAYKSIRLFRGDSAFFTWLYRIAINNANRSFVRASRMPLVLDISQQFSNPYGQTESQIDRDTPEVRLESKQLGNLLNSVLDSLPPEQSSVFVLREIEGMSYEEIAEQLKCPIGTVRSRIHRVREIVSDSLKKHTGENNNKKNQD